MTRNNPPPGTGTDWFRARRVPRTTLWSYSAVALIGADLAGWLPQGQAVGIAVISAGTMALAREIFYRAG
ncbi:hypothetical protein ACIPSE_45915 [Streptomyces sp. NPDC090106]|uniref:hypothetical protein n=1 Tax=Streptomyces sp. NPDC090106 TaxID=3365946 RepID=UPI0037FE2590